MRSRATLLVLFLLAACDLPSYEPGKGAKGVPMARDAMRMRAGIEIEQLRTESEQFHALKGEWPDGWQDLRRGGLDPWGEEYLLEVDGNRAVVYSSGPDREIGTGDDVHGG